MTNARVLLAALLLAVPAAPASAAESPAAAVQDQFRKVVDSVRPAVVSIDIVFEREEEDASPFFFGDPEEFMRRFFGQGQGQGGEGEEEQPAPKKRKHRLQGVGSGVITDPRGYILTNEHVVGGAKEIKVVVRTPKEKTYRGKVVGTDPLSDLAVVKIKADGALPYAKLGDSGKVKIGDWAIAIGSPFGLEQTVTVGVVSALRQSLPVEERVYGDFLQTDAAINRGNSGGPLVNIDGEVIGINTAIFSPSGASSGIGFAIPSDQAAGVMKSLIEKGKVVRGWVGVEITGLDDVLARRFGVPNGEGALVNRVLPGSPAEKAGLKRGDVVTECDGRKVASPGDFTKLVAAVAPGAKIDLRLVRDGKPLALSLAAGERPAKIQEGREPGAGGQPEERGAESSTAWQGARLITPDADDKKAAGQPADASGALVAAVEPDSAAEQMGLRPGDLVVAADGKPVDGAPAFAAAAKKADLDKGVVLDVRRRGRPLYLTYQRTP